MHRSPSRRLSALAGLFVLSLLSCGREVTGPDDGSLFGRVADLAVAPSLPGPMSVVDGSGSVVPFNRVRVILRRTNGEEFLSRVIDFPASATEVPLSLEFPLPPDAPRDGLPLQLLLRYLNVAGDTVFAGGPVQVIAQPRVEGQEPQQVPVELEWVGPGSQAVRVEIAPPTDTVVSGTSTTFTAVAYDAQDAVVQNAPIVYSTPDPTRASLGAAGTGAVTWLAVRGQARVIASLPSGEADTALVDVALPASVLSVVSGSGQSALASAPLSAPIVLRVEASDAVPVAGVPVSFAVATGGGSLETLTDTSDANGEVSTSWTLGALVGTQTVTATFPGLATPTVITATAGAPAATQLVITSGIGPRVAGIVGAPVVVEARDASNALAVAFTGPVTAWVEVGPEGTNEDSVTVNAVAGVATFAGAIFDQAGTYELRFRSAGLTDATSAPFVVSPGAPAVLTIASGDGQTGTVGTVIAQALTVLVTDLPGNPVPGVTVNFAVASGGGLVLPTTATTDASGSAQTTWTLGALLGAQSVTASATGLTGVTFTANAVAVVGGLRTWTGAVSTDWATAGNWSGGLVPTSLDTVLVTAAATFDPALVPTDSVVISGLTIEDGASVAIGDAALIVVGSLVAPDTPSITVGLDGGLGLLGTTGTVQGTLPTVFFGGGSYTPSGALAVEGNLTVINGTFTVDAFPVTVQSDFFTGGTGVLAMLPGSVMTVNGDALFTGGSTAGFLSGGRLNIGGDFVQSGATSPSSFSADAGHETWFTSAVPQSITFLTPGTGPTLSHFGTLYSSQATGGTIDLASDVWVDGALETGIAITAKRFTGAGETIYSRGADIDAAGIQFEGVQWHLLDGALVQAIQSVTFTAMDPTVTQWRIARAGGPITVPGLVFQTLLDGGLFLEVEDTAPLDQNVLTVDVTGVVPEAHEGGLSQLGGAQVIGWTATAGFRWTGTTSTDWATASNWAGGVVPTAADSVHIPAGTLNAPVLTTAAAIRTLTMEPGTTLDHGASILTIAGSLDLPPTAQITGAPGGRVLLAVGIGNPGTVRGTVYDVWINEGDYVLAGDLTIAAGLDIYFGDLSIGNFTLTVGTSIFVGQAGTMTMTGTGVVDVVDMDFDGASTAGRLTNGTLRVRGRFDQIATESDQGFSASGAHVVELIGTATQNVWLRSADSSLTTGCTRSCFATLRAIKPPGSGGVRFLTSVKALTELALQADSIAAPAFGLVSTGRPVFDSPIVRAASIAYRDSLVQNSSARTIDSLIAWGVGTPLATIPGVRTVVAGAPVIRGSHASRIDVTGTLDVDGPARIAGNLRTLGAGRLQMLEAVDSLNVDSTATFSGGPTTGLLTAGVLRVGGNFTQSINAGAFAAGGTHRTRIYNGCALCDGLFFTITDTTGTTFGELLVESGNWDLTGVARASGNVAIAAGAVLDNGGNARVRTTGNFTQAPSAGLGLSGLSVGGVLTIPGGAFPVDTVVFTGTGQILPFIDAVSADISYRSVRVTGTATALIPPSGTPQSMTGNLTVEGTLGFTGTTGSNLTIGGNLTVQGAAARLLSSGTFHRLTVLGDARFDGAAATGDLASGLLTLTGDLVQAATHSAASLAPLSDYTIELVGTGVISFATPAQSSVGNLEIMNVGVARTLTTDLTATGFLQLDADGGSITSNVLGAGGTRNITAPDAYSYAGGGFTLRNVALRLGYIDVDGQLVMDDFDPTVVQIDLAAGSGGSFFAGLDYRTTPTGTGRYVRVTDLTPLDGDDYNLSVSISPQIVPEYHGGFAEAVAPATITGWDAVSNFRWTGAVNTDWSFGGNWANTRVPTSTDSVYIPDGVPNTPALPINGVQVRAFVSDYLGAFNFGAPLRVTQRFVVPATADITCDGGLLQLVGDGVTDVQVSGRLQSNCLVQSLSGTTVAAGPFTVLGDLQVEGTAMFDVSRETVTVGGNFSTLVESTLRMTDPAGQLIVDGGASFGGGSTAGLLTAGTLQIGGNFSQAGDYAEGFAASGAHLTRFAGSVVQQVSFLNAGTGAGTSHFADLELSQIEPGAYVQLNSNTWAEGVLRTGLGTVRQLRKGAFGIPEQAAVFQSRGADVDAAQFFNVRWEIVDGASIGRIDNVSFTAMDSSATYLTMRRSADAVVINGMQFVSGPEEGAYLRLEDPNGATGLFQVTMNNTGGGGLTFRPPFLNSNVFVVAPAVLIGWP